MTSPLRLLLQPSQITNEKSPPIRTHVHAYTRTHVVTLVTIVTSN